MSVCLRAQGWARPSQALALQARNGGNGNPNPNPKPAMIRSISPYNIEQELVTDCSFVSSLCIASAYERRFRKQLITNIIYPQNRHGVPIYNPGGKYMVRLWFNGIARKVRSRSRCRSHS